MSCTTHLDVYVEINIRHTVWQDVVLESPTAAGTITGGKLSALAGVNMSADRFCHCACIITVHDTVTKLDWCVVDIKV